MHCHKATQIVLFYINCVLIINYFEFEEEKFSPFDNLFCLESYYKLSISGIIFMKNAFEVGQFIEIYSVLPGLLKMLKFRTDGQLYNRSTFQRASKCSYNVSTLGLKGSEHSLCMSLRLWKLNYRVLLWNKVLEARTTNLLKSSKQKYLKCSQPKMFKYIKMHFKIITSWT